MSPWIFAAVRRTSANGWACVCRQQNNRQLWVPEGFAHGFVVLSDDAEFLYKTTDYYQPSAERSILWNDPTLAIDWELTEAPQLSAKDQAGKLPDGRRLFP